MSGRERLRVVLAGHVDHGKSTVLGRLLADAEGLPEGRVEQVRELCRGAARPFEYAFLLDALKDEQAQGITIDAARVFFRTAARDYLFVDAPGHVEFLRNMVTGASRADAAFLVIDVHEGVRENSRRHASLLRLLGVPRVVVLANKMDLAGFTEESFLAVRSEFDAFAREAALPVEAFIPVSGTGGDNVARRSGNMPWYSGPTVLEALDALPSEPEDASRPLRFPVQDVYRFGADGDRRRIVAGTVASGTLRAGDELVFYPSGKSSRAATLEGGREAAGPGDAVGVTLDEQVYVRRGELAVRRGDVPPLVVRRLRASVLWLGKRPLEPGRDYHLKLGSARVGARLESLTSARDTSTLALLPERSSLGRGEVGECVLVLGAPVACDPAERDVRTARFVLVDEHRICGGGLVREALADPGTGLRERVIQRNLHWQRSLVSAESRERRYGQRAGLVLVTGADMERRKGVAKALERLLFEAGRPSYYLGIGSVLYGLDSDIRGQGKEREDLRRLAEVAFIMLDAGLILVATASELTQDDLEVARTAVEEGRVLSVWVGDAVTTDIRCDMKADGADGEASASAVFAALAERGFLSPPSVEDLPGGPSQNRID